MVAMLIASLIAAVAIWLYLRSQNGASSGQSALDKRASDAAIAANAKDGDVYTLSDGTVYKKLDGNVFVVSPGPAMQAAASSGATAYDANNPDAAQRRLDALNRAQTEQSLADAQGVTVDQLYQAHLAQNLAAQQKETATIMAVGGGGSTTMPPPPPPTVPSTATGSTTGPTVEARRGLSHFGGAPASSAPAVSPQLTSNADYAAAILKSGPPGPPPTPGMTWDYASQQWAWALA